jgi:hypothetical protein
VTSQMLVHDKSSSIIIFCSLGVEFQIICAEKSAHHSTISGASSHSFTFFFILFAVYFLFVLLKR